MTNTLPRLLALPLDDAANPLSRPDAGALPRLGGLSPLFPPATVADAGQLRMGGLSPLFGHG
ncbi:hypothetical protein AAFN86_27645 [Roseomonas sp. CAU 1739]|uniref:hypothetical protein n=1 Tax=Roseomonas sp. CAU 1739 TaxID=3140364 RepID=UPI00325C0A7C